jgi:hypothetical protein
MRYKHRNVHLFSLKATGVAVSMLWIVRVSAQTVMDIWTRQAMYVYPYTEARVCDHYCSGKANEYYTTCVCVCSLRYPAYNAHAPYFHLWSAPLYNIFPNYVINVTVLEKRYWTQNVCLVFLYKFCLKYFFILTRTERDMIENVYWSSCKVPFIFLQF